MSIPLTDFHQRAHCRVVEGEEAQTALTAFLLTLFDRAQKEELVATAVKGKFIFDRREVRVDRLDFGLTREEGGRL